MSSRSGRSNSLFSLAIVAFCIVGVASFLLMKGGPGEIKDGKKIVVACAAGMRVPMEKLAFEYEKEFGVVVELQYGGSQDLLNKLKLNKFSEADLYLAGDDFYTQKAVDMGLAKEQLPIAYMRPVIVVKIDSKLKIKSIRDLMQQNLRVVMGNHKAAAVGRAVKNRLQKISLVDPERNQNPDSKEQAKQTTLWDDFYQHVTNNGVFKPTVTDVATDVKLGTVDAGIIWDSTVAMPKYRNELKAISVPELDGNPNLVTVAVLAGSERTTAAIRFARFISSSDRGLPVFKNYGFRPVDGDRWARNPKLTFFCGAVNRSAVEQVIEEFAKREGVEVRTSFDGCGILTGKMAIVDDQDTNNGFPDIFMACDRFYLDKVQNWFETGVDISKTRIVLVTPKGQDKVKSLQDLVEPGIRVAIGESKQCTIGAITQRMLSKKGLYEKLKTKQKQDGELVVEKSSSALIIPDVVAGHVDAAIAYASDAKRNLDDVDMIEIDSSLNVAVQPFSVSKTSHYKNLANRLLNRIRNSRAEFEKAGFEFSVK